MNKMTGGELICSLILIRVFTLMTYIPSIYAKFTGVEIMLSILISGFLQAVLVLPVMKFFKVEGDIFAYAKTKNALLGNILAIVYSLIMILFSVKSLTGFECFLDSVGGENSGFKGMLIILPVCLYGLVGGISALGKFSGIIMGVFILTLVSIGIFSLGDFNILNFAPILSRESNIINAVIYDLSVSFELIPFVFFMGKINASPRKYFFKFLGLKTIILQIIALIITGVLGEYAKIAEYPFFKVGSYTGIHAIERMDALYIIFWTLNAVLTVTVFLSAASELLKIPFKKLKYRNLIVIIMTAVFLLISPERKISEGIYLLINFTALFVIPLILLIWRKPNENQICFNSSFNDNADIMSGDERSK